MKVLSAIEAAQEIARGTGKPVLYISNLSPGPECDDSWIDDKGRLRAAPYLDIENHGQAIFEDTALVVCEDEEEQRHLFDLTYGNDGVTKRGRAARLMYGAGGYPLYEGKHKVYALIIAADGTLLTTNS